MLSKARKKKLRFHESTQRTLCRLVFLWLALLPVLSVTSYGILLSTPWYQSNQKERWQRRLSDNLGVDVRFKAIEFPSPNKFRAHDLVCYNVETGREIMKIAKVQASMDRSGWMVDVESAVLNVEQIQTAMQVVHDRFICRPQDSASLLGLLMPELLISDGVNTTKIQNVNVGFKPTESISKLVVWYSMEETKFPSLAQFSVARDHIAESTNWTIDTKSTAVACKVLSSLFPSVKHLGSQASFRGMIDGRQKNSHWETTIRGDFHSIDLAAASVPFGQPLRGFGKLSIENASFSGEALRSAKGLLTSHGCSVNTDWLDQLTDAGMLYTNDTKPWREIGTSASANRIGIRFQMNEHGLRFAGETTQPPSDAPSALLAAYIGTKPIAFTDSALFSSNGVATALYMYMNSDVELQPSSRIARGRE